LNEGGWALGSSQGYNEEQDAILVQSLVSLKTRAKDDQGRTYWVYPAEEMLDHYEKKNVLEIRPSVTLAKNIKRKEPVFALLNREMVEAICAGIFADA